MMTQLMTGGAGKSVAIREGFLEAVDLEQSHKFRVGSGSVERSSCRVEMPGAERPGQCSAGSLYEAMDLGVLSHQARLSLTFRCSC